MDLRIDHVTIAGRDLEQLTAAFTAAGLPAEYGGTHSNDVTEMSIVGFRDGSYLELVSTVEPGLESPWWDEPIRRNGGPCAWAVGVDDIAAATSTFRDRGIAVDGPAAYERRREDGVLVEWDLTFLGDGDPGSLLPFLISDRTPRNRRVQPTGDLASAPVSGVEIVIVGVRDLAAAVDRLRTALDLDAPVRGSVEQLHADIAVFGDAPVALASPRDDGWLAERLEAFGPLPVAYLLGSDPGVTDRFDDLETGSIAGRRVDWLPLTAPVGRRYLGLVGHTTEAGPRGEGRT